jgi:L-lactate dehydrogenase complex protein LldE
MRRVLEIFAEAEAVVVPSTSCAAMLREQYRRLAEFARDPELAARAEQVAGKTWEFTEFLVRKLEVEDVGAYYPHRVTYHASCNSLRSLRLGDAPTKLLRHVRGLELIELPHYEECCGFGGTFAVKNADVSAAMLADKMRHVLETAAEVCTAGDNSCLMHIGGGLHRLRTGVRTIHIAEILAATET